MAIPRLLPVASCLLLLTASAAARQAGPIQVLGISAGVGGHESNGVFVFAEERSIFSRSGDREVIVSFQWEDVPGLHKLVAHWRSPDGAASASSAIDYTATRPRFGAYWRLPLTPGMPLGQWSVDVTMDGRPAGRFTFEITDIKIEAPVTRSPLTAAELYARVSRRFVVLRRATETGRELDAAAGVLGSSGGIYTDLGAVDGATELWALMGDGAALELTHLMAWNRSQGWAVLHGGASPDEPLSVAAYDRMKVGARCYSMEGTTGGARVIIEGTISGHDLTRSGEPRLIVSWHNAFGMPGAPVLDEYGDMIGIIGGGMPDATLRRDDLAPRITPVIPFGMIRTRPGAVPVDMAALRATGAIIPPVVDTAGVVTGGFTRPVVKRNDPAGSAFVEDFSVRDTAVGLLLTWSPLERLRGQALVRAFNSDNEIVMESRSRKVDFRKGSLKRSTWEMPMFKSPGRYRVDVLIDEKIYWRGHVRVNP